MASREVWSTAKARAWRNLPAQPSTTRPLVVTVFSGMVILALKSLLENVEKVCVLRSCDIPIEAPIKKRSTHRSYWMPPSAGSKAQSSQFSFLIKPSIALKCNVTHWTNWSPCCKGETTRKKVVLTSLGGKLGLAPICKTKKEVFNCDQDQCAGELGLQ